MQRKTLGGLSTAGEGTSSIVEAGVVLGVEQGGGGGHGHASDSALVGSLQGLLQRTGQFLGQEGLPGLLAAQVCILLLPVGVVGELTCHGNDHVDVLIHVEINNIGLHHPVSATFTAVATIKKVDGGTRLGVVLRGDHEQRHVAVHGRGICPHFLHTVGMFCNLFAPHRSRVNIALTHRHRGLGGASSLLGCTLARQGGGSCQCRTHKKRAGSDGGGYVSKSFHGDLHSPSFS